MKPLTFNLSPELELERIITILQASNVSTLSEDTIRRRHADKIIKLSPRRDGMKLRDALSLRRPP
jgi:hypothetical protein